MRRGTGGVKVLEESKWFDEKVRPALCCLTAGWRYGRRRPVGALPFGRARCQVRAHAGRSRSMRHLRVRRFRPCRSANTPARCRPCTPRRSGNPHRFPWPVSAVHAAPPGPPVPARGPDDPDPSRPGTRRTGPSSSAAAACPRAGRQVRGAAPAGVPGTPPHPPRTGRRAMGRPLGTRTAARRRAGPTAGARTTARGRRRPRPVPPEPHETSGTAPRHLGKEPPSS